eukprot:NODE_367_length_8687_cov_0.577084.p9 type:complete len:113 gc:universal NODE_367_length_8687_cov_0.577084:6794-6456(-)
MRILVKDYDIMVKSYIEKAEIYTKFFENEDLLAEVIQHIRSSSQAIGITPSQFCSAWFKVATFIGTPNDADKVKRLFITDTEIDGLKIKLSREDVKGVIRALYNTQTGSQCL